MSESNDRLELALKASNEGIWEWNLVSGTIFYSNRVLKFLGYGITGAPNFFKDAEEHIHPEDLKKFIKKRDRVLLKNGRLFAMESRVRTRSGEWKWFRMRGIPERDDQGKVLKMVGSLIDISKRKNTEKALMEERARIDLVLESVPVNVYFKDRESRFVRANKSTALRMGAGSVKELIGKTDHDFFEKSHADASRAKELEIMETGSEKVDELEHEVWEDQEDSWVLVTKKAWRSREGEILGTFGVTNDVTELMKTRKNLERVSEQLQIVNQDIDEERQLLRLVIDNIPMFVYFKDLDSRFVLVNQRMADLCGEDSPEDLKGKHDRDYFTESLYLESQKIEKGIMEKRDPIVNKLEEISWKDNCTTWSMSSKFPWYDPDGNLIGTFGVSGDVTELVQTRNDLSKIAEDLGKKNEAMEEELSLAREIQQAGVPKSLPEIDGGDWNLKFRHIYQPATDLAGDFLEVKDLGAGRAGFLVCDVMGHGVRAALIVSMLRGLVEKQGRLAGTPGEFLAGLNDGLSHLLERTGLTMFATASYGVVDSQKGEVSLASAGHPSPIGKIAGKVEVLDFAKGAKGPALGMLPGMSYGEMVLSLGELESLWCFTDGVFEVQDRSDQEYGRERMKKILASESGSRIVELVDDAREFSAGRGFDDDVCLLELEVSPKA